MSLTATVPQAVPAVNPVRPVAYSTSGLRGVTLQNPHRPLGLRFLEVAAFEAAAGRVTADELAYLDAHSVAISAEIALLQRDPEAAIQLIQPCSMTSSDFRTLGAEAFAQWQHSRFARTQKRARKTPKTCKICTRKGRPCGWHGGGK